LTCIPVLAPLFKFFSQKLSTYGHGSRNIKESHNMKVLSTPGTTANASSKVKSYADISASNESQESILAGIGHARSTSDERVKNGEILRTIRVDVESIQRRENETGHPSREREYFA
jgi:hypothetical protein